MDKIIIYGFIFTVLFLFVVIAIVGFICLLKVVHNQCYAELNVSDIPKDAKKIIIEFS